VCSLVEYELSNLQYLLKWIHTQQTNLAAGKGKQIFRIFLFTPNESKARIPVPFFRDEPHQSQGYKA